MKKPSTLFSVATALILGLAGNAVSAQATTASIAGQVQATDTVIVQNPGTGFNREVKPKSDGRYSLRNLQTGTYTVIVKHADGSADEPKVVTLRVGQSVRIQ